MHDTLRIMFTRRLTNPAAARSAFTSHKPLLLTRAFIRCKCCGLVWVKLFSATDVSYTPSVIRLRWIFDRSMCEHSLDMCIFYELSCAKCCYILYGIRRYIPRDFQFGQPREIHAGCQWWCVRSLKTNGKSPFEWGFLCIFIFLRDKINFRQFQSESKCLDCT